MPIHIEALECRTFMSAAPDLTVAIEEWSGPSGTCVPGDRFNALVRITNSGNAAVQARFDPECYLAPEGTSSTPSGIPIGLDQITTSLAPGAYTTVAIRGKLDMFGSSVYGPTPAPDVPFGPKVVLSMLYGGSYQEDVASATFPQQYAVRQEFGNVGTRKNVPLSLFFPAAGQPVGANVTFRLVGPGTGYLTDDGSEIVLAGTTRRSELLVGDHTVSALLGLGFSARVYPVPPIHFDGLVRPGPLRGVILSHAIVAKIVDAASPIPG